MREMRGPGKSGAAPYLAHTLARTDSDGKGRSHGLVEWGCKWGLGGLWGSERERRESLGDALVPMPLSMGVSILCPRCCPRVAPHALSSY
jgi:hypothetical protein